MLYLIWWRWHILHMIAAQCSIGKLKMGQPEMTQGGRKSISINMSPPPSRPREEHISTSCNELLLVLHHPAWIVLHVLTSGTLRCAQATAKHGRLPPVMDANTGSRCSDSRAETDPRIFIWNFSSYAVSKHLMPRSSVSSDGFDGSVQQINCVVYTGKFGMKIIICCSHND